MKIIIFFLICAVILESSLITLPFTLLIIIYSAVVIRRSEIFFLAFLSGLFLDILKLEPIGVSSIYFVTVTFIIFSYQRKLEINSIHFVGAASLIGSLIYLFLIGANNLILQSLTSALIALLSFLAFKKSNKKNLKYA